MNIESPYITFDNEFPTEYHSHDINPLDENKRVRVYCGQLQDSVIADLTLANYNRLGGWYIGQGIKLIDKFPDKEIELSRAIVTYWRRSQTKYKLLKDE
jgi:hypothetical protein